MFSCSSSCTESLFIHFISIHICKTRVPCMPECDLLFNLCGFMKAGRIRSRSGVDGAGQGHSSAFLTERRYQTEQKLPADRLMIRSTQTESTPCSCELGVEDLWGFCSGCLHSDCWRNSMFINTVYTKHMKNCGNQIGADQI